MGEPREQAVLKIYGVPNSQPVRAVSLRPNLQFCCRKWSVGIKSYLLVSLKMALMVPILIIRVF